MGKARSEHKKRVDGRLGESEYGQLVPTFVAHIFINYLVLYFA